MSTVSMRLPGEAIARARARPLPTPDPDGPVIGVLALQGDVLEHVRMLRAAGAHTVVVNRPGHLDAIDGILIPGGESTTIGKLLVMYGLLEPLRARLSAGLPAFGTCAGAILLGSRAWHADGRVSDQPLLEVMDTTLRRNAFGRQVASFEGDLDVKGLDAPMHAVFIRAPWFEELGPEVETLAQVETEQGVRVVVARQGHVLASAFHPELTADGRLHAMFTEDVRAASTAQM